MTDRDDAELRGRALGIAVVMLAAVPALGALALSIATATDPLPVVRLLVTAVVYAPVSAIALSLRRADIAGLTGLLAITSGWLAAAMVLREVFPDAAALGPAVVVALHAARLPELAALALLPWLIGRDRTHPYRLGIAAGFGAVVVSVPVSIVTADGGAPTWVGLIPFAWAIASFMAGSVALWRRWRVGGERERTALAWFAAGVALLVLSYGRLLASLVEPLAVLNDAAFVLAQGFLPAGILAAIVTDHAAPPARRTIDGIAWAQSLAFGIAAYLAITATARLLGLDPTVAGAVAAGGLALVLGGAIRSLRARTARLFADAAPDARAVLASLGARVGEGAAAGSVAGIAAALRDTWQLASVEIVLTGAGTAGAAALAGAPSTEAVTSTLVSGGQLIGTITLTSPSHRTLHTAVQPVLTQTAGLIAVAVQLATVNEEVAATRSRTLDVRREERRMLHGELHDQLAPSLAGIGFGMAAADALITSGDARTAIAIADLRDQTAACTEDVRQLARTLIPTALDQGDLEGALDELATTVLADGLRVQVEAHATDMLEADLQLGVYLMLAEAVMRARRLDRVHALAASVRIDDAAVHLSVRVLAADDGPHDSSESGAGAIVDALARRIDELGGGATVCTAELVEAVIAR